VLILGLPIGEHGKKQLEFIMCQADKPFVIFKPISGFKKGTRDDGLVS
jgi:hypothetical protein